MPDRLWTLWWLAGAVLIGIAVPLAAIMVVMDHRRHRYWPRTGLAILWCVLALGIVGASQGNMSPPLFGVPLVLLYTLAWTQKKALFAIGVTSAYCLGVLVVILVARQRPSDVNWWFLLPWLVSLLVVVFWHARRPAEHFPLGGMRRL